MAAVETPWVLWLELYEELIWGLRQFRFCGVTSWEIGK